MLVLHYNVFADIKWGMSRKHAAYGYHNHYTQDK